MDDIHIDSVGDDDADIEGYVSDEGIVLRIRENNEILHVVLRIGAAQELAQWLLNACEVNPNA